MRGLRAVLQKVCAVFEYLSCILVCVCTLSAFANTVMRYVVSRPISWSEEMSVLTLIWVVYLTQCKMEYDNSQLTMTAVYRLMGARLQKAVNLIRSVITIAISGHLFYAGLNIVQRNYTLKVYTQVLNVPYWLTYFVIPVAFAVIALIRLANPLVIDLDDAAEKGDGGKCCGA